MSEETSFVALGQIFSTIVLVGHFSENVCRSDDELIAAGSAVVHQLHSMATMIN